MAATVGTCVAQPVAGASVLAKIPVAPDFTELAAAKILQEIGGHGIRTSFATSMLEFVEVTARLSELDRLVADAEEGSAADSAETRKWKEISSMSANFARSSLLQRQLSAVDRLISLGASGGGLLVEASAGAERSNNDSLPTPAVGMAKDAHRGSAPMRPPPGLPPPPGLEHLGLQAAAAPKGSMAHPQQPVVGTAGHATRLVPREPVVKAMTPKATARAAEKRKPAVRSGGGVRQAAKAPAVPAEWIQVKQETAMPMCMVGPMVALNFDGYETDGEE